MCVGGGVAVDVSKAVPSNETSRHTNRMRKETVNAESVVGCILARALAFAVSVAAAASIIGCWGLSIEDLGILHGVIGACLGISIISEYGGMANTLTISLCFL